MREIKIGLLGCGNVGAPLVELISEQHDEVLARTGLDLVVARIAVRSLSKSRGIDVPEELFTSDAAAVVDDPDIDVIVEVIGGIEPARELILAALRSGKPVVTGNKELLANFGAELYAVAAENRVDLLFEAAVAAGIPLMRPLRESLVGEPIRQVLGIVNGTTNFILSKMSDEGVSYADALSEAQSLGYAERDPTADVEGFDAGAKAAIIASIAFGANVVAGDVYHEGISAVTGDDIDFAARIGHVIKLLAIAELAEPASIADGTAPEVAVRVHPALVPDTHPLASVRDSFNAVFISGGSVGDLMMYGRGAGGRPTASAILGDLIDASLNLEQGSFAKIGDLPRARIRPIDDVESAFSISVDVADSPGVLAQVAQVFGGRGVSIRTMEQAGLGEAARLTFITHVAREADVRQCLAEIEHLDVVRSSGSLMRVIAG